MPIPAVKNSNTKSDRPMANNKYATGGLATVCINWPSKPSLKKRAVVASRTICPLLSTFSTTVSSATPSTIRPSSASNMFRTTGTPSSVPAKFSRPAFRASAKPRLDTRICVDESPKLVSLPFTTSAFPVNPMRAPGAIAVTSATANNCALKP